jgi:hypothetical protein
VEDAISENLLSLAVNIGTMELYGHVLDLWEFDFSLTPVYLLLLLLLLLFNLAGNGILPGGSVTTIRHNTKIHILHKITQLSNITQYTKLHKQ